MKKELFTGAFIGAFSVVVIIIYKLIFVKEVIIDDLEFEIIKD